MKPDNIMMQDATQTKVPSLDDILEAAQNVAELLEEELLERIAEQVLDDFKIDRDSMGEWLQAMESAIKLASQMAERKTQPWPGAANVKHTLILEACIQFASRAVPEFIRDNQVVKTKYFGKDPQGIKQTRGGRVADFMNYELIEGMMNWEDGFDRMLHVFAMMGTVFKKTYYCPVSKHKKSVLCLPDKITINQNVETLEDARRVTHEIELFESQITERQLGGIFLDVELKEDINQEQPENDPCHVFLEQHRYLDLDGDGYPEPYVVTVHETSRKVVRIAPCFDMSTVTQQVDERDRYVVVMIEKNMQYFSDFHFIRTIDGGYFSYGFGYLLSHGTQVINTIINQLLDAGTLENLQSGFVGKGARIKGGEINFRPGQWIKADASGVDLKNSIVPLPTKGPSQTLFTLMQFLLSSYYKMISISEIMSGQISGSNTTAAEAMQAVEQGMKVMNAIHARIYRGLRKEFKQIYLLNHYYPDQDLYTTVLDDPEADIWQDFEIAGLDLVPVADPKKSSQLEEMMRLKIIMELSDRIPEIQRIAIGRRLLAAMRIDDIDEILPPVDPNKPTPQQLQFAEELQRQADALQLQDRELKVKEGDLQLKVLKAQYEIQKIMAEAQLAAAKAQTEGIGPELEMRQQEIRKLEAIAKYIQAITPDRGPNDNP